MADLLFFHFLQSATLHQAVQFFSQMFTILIG